MSAYCSVFTVLVTSRKLFGLCKTCDFFSPEPSFGLICRDIFFDIIFAEFVFSTLFSDDINLGKRCLKESILNLRDGVLYYDILESSRAYHARYHYGPPVIICFWYCSRDMAQFFVVSIFSGNAFMQDCLYHAWLIDFCLIEFALSRAQFKQLKSSAVVYYRQSNEKRAEVGFIFFTF